jgi:hypothetical protein
MRGNRIITNVEMDMERVVIAHKYYYRIEIVYDHISSYPSQLNVH